MTRWHVLRMQIMLNIMLIDKNSLCLLTKRAQPLFSLSLGHPVTRCFHCLLGTGHPVTRCFHCLWEPLGTFGNLWEPLGTFWEPVTCFHCLWELLGTFGNFWEPLQVVLLLAQYAQISSTLNVWGYSGPVGTFLVWGVLCNHYGCTTVPKYKKVWKFLYFLNLSLISYGSFFLGFISDIKRLREV